MLHQLLGPHRRRHGVVAGPRQVPQRLDPGGRHVHGLELAVNLGHLGGQPLRVAPVVLEEPVLGAARDAGNGDRIAAVAETPDVAAGLEPARAGLVGEVDWAGEP